LERIKFMSFRYFKVNVTGGFRLTDLNKDLKQGQYFYVENDIVRTSKAVQAALRHNWIVEVNSAEASPHIEIVPVKKITPLPAHLQNKINPTFQSSSQSNLINKNFTLSNKIFADDDFTDVTFIIPIIIDSQDRLDNLKIILQWLNLFFKTNIIICEQDDEQIKKILQLLDLQNLQISYVILSGVREDHEFHKTHLLNLMTKMVNTPFGVSYDVDVLFKKEQYIQSIKLLRTNNADLVFPYDHCFYDVPKNVCTQIINSKSLDFINLKDCVDLNTNSVGGAIFWNRQKFIEGGMENENFVSYGPEDEERYERFKKLGYQIQKIQGCVYHLHHIRGKNSSLTNPFSEKNKMEFEKIKAMSVTDLRAYTHSWSWVKE
jgi:hypothetical protein